MKYNIGVILFFFLILNAKAQIEITGFVKDINKSPIESANVVLFDSLNNILTFSYTKTDGKYFIKFEPNTNTYFIIIANSLGFETKKDTIQLNPNKKKYEISFNLKEKIEVLNEIVLKPDEKISKEGTVTTFKVSAFKNDTEQTVEDLLKKIPGIEVLKNGSIKAHGRFIDKLLVEGEDMFNKNYTILSKNLDAKVLDEVQILDDFEDNPILAKVLNSDKVALNLVLKENYKNIWFGNISSGLGSEKRIRAASNLGLIRKEIKFFNFNDYNNLGKKASEQLKGAPSSISTNNSFKEQNIEPNINPIYSIENNESTVFKEGQSTFNKAFIDALSFVTNLKKGLKLRGTGYFTNDKQNQLFSSETTYNTNETPILYSENSKTNIENVIAGGELELKFNTSEKSYLKNDFVYNNKPKRTNNQSLFNDNNIRQTLKQNEYSFFNHLNYSYLIGKKNMLHSYLYFGEDVIKQDAIINSPIFNSIFELPENADINHLSNDKVTTYGGKSTMLINFNKFKNNIELGYEYIKENRKNKFILHDNDNIINVDSLQNNIIFKQKKIHLKANSKYTLSKNVEITAGLSFDYINIHTDLTENKKLLFNPRVGLALKNLKIGYFSLNFSKNYSEPKSNLFVTNYQLSNYQSFTKGQNDIYFPKNNLLSFYYQLSNDMQTKTISVRTQYISSNGRYSTENKINPNLILTSYKFVNSGDLLFSNVTFTSYFKDIQLSTNLGSSQSFSKTPIKANTSEFKSLKTNNSSYFLSGTTYFKLPINFNFNFNFNQSKSNFNNIQSKTSWKTFDLNTTYKLTEILIASLNNNFYLTPDSNYFFIDFKLNYNPKESRFSYQFVLNNLTNENLFTITEINEFSKYKSNIQLLPRYLYLLVKYRF